MGQIPRFVALKLHVGIILTARRNIKSIIRKKLRSNIQIVFLKLYTEKSRQICSDHYYCNFNWHTIVMLWNFVEQNSEYTRGRQVAHLRI